MNGKQNINTAQPFDGLRQLTKMPRAVVRAYHREFLTMELPLIALNSDPQTLLRNQVEFLAQSTGQAVPDGLTVSFGERSSIGRFHTLKNGLDNWSGVIKWRKSGRDIAISDLALAMRGNFVRSCDIPSKTDTVWEDFQEQVLRSEGISELATVNFQVPLHADRRLMIAYAFAEPLGKTNMPTRYEFDFITTPFAIVWLYKFHLIDETTMRRWLYLLSGLTPIKLFLIRELLAGPRYQVALTMERTGLTKRNLENHIYQLSELLDEKVPREAELKGYGAALVDIVNIYGFLSFTGRPQFQISEAGSDET